MSTSIMEETITLQNLMSFYFRLKIGRSDPWTWKRVALAYGVTPVGWISEYQGRGDIVLDAIIAQQGQGWWEEYSDKDPLSIRFNKIALSAKAMEGFQQWRRWVRETMGALWIPCFIIERDEEQLREEFQERLGRY